jgi:hypothetical protein
MFGWFQRRASLLVVQRALVAIYACVCEFRRRRWSSVSTRFCGKEEVY